MNIKYNSLLCCDVGIVDKVVQCEIPVCGVAFYEAWDHNKAQHHQVDSSEDFVDEGRLAHAKGKQT